MKLALFIDQANMWSTYKTAGKNIDMVKLLDFIETKFGGKIVFRGMYLAYPEVGTREYDVSGIHKFATYLEKGLHFQVRKKPLKRIVERDSEGNIKLGKDGKPQCQEKGNMDIELAIDVVLHNKEFDTMILMSGDSDFMPLVRFLRVRGKKSYVLSSEGHISSELRTGSDGYTDLILIDSIWGSKLLARNEKP